MPWTGSTGASAAAATGSEAGNDGFLSLMNRFRDDDGVEDAGRNVDDDDGTFELMLPPSTRLQRARSHVTVQCQVTPTGRNRRR